MYEGTCGKDPIGKCKRKWKLILKWILKERNGRPCTRLLTQGKENFQDVANRVLNMCYHKTGEVINCWGNTDTSWRSSLDGFSFLFVRSFGWLLDWLVSWWLSGWLDCWLIGWLVACLIALLVVWLVGWLFGRMVVRVVDWLVSGGVFGWLVGCFVCWLVCWLVDWLFGWLCGWLVGWLFILEQSLKSRLFKRNSTDSCNKQDRQCRYKCNYKARSRSHFCRGKAISISYSECVCLKP